MLARIASSRQLTIDSALHGSFKAARSRGDPLRKFCHAWMSFEPRDCVVLALELLLREQCVYLRMTRTANADHLSNDDALELSFVALVVVPRARDQVMARERFLATADRAVPLHCLR